MHSLILLIALATFSDACHEAVHKRRKRTAEGRAEGIQAIKNFFPDCIGVKTDDDNMELESVVKFVVEHTTWYETTSDVTCSSAEGLDTVKCWRKEVDDLLVKDTRLYFAFEKCLNEFNIFVKTNKKITDREVTYDPSVKLRTDKELCPNRTESKYLSCVNDGLKHDQLHKNPIDDFESAERAVKRYFKCSHCNCADVKKEDGSFSTYFNNKNLSCDSCWSTRMAGLVKTNSVLTHPLRACSATLNDPDVVSNAYGGTPDVTNG